MFFKKGKTALRRFPTKLNSILYEVWYALRSRLMGCLLAPNGGSYFTIQSLSLMLSAVLPNWLRSAAS